MKTFKQYIKENTNEFKNINNVFAQYVNGDMPDPYENEQENPKELFKQIYNLFSDNNVNLIILKNGKRFDGNGIIIDTNKEIHFDLASDSEENLIPYKLHVEIKKRSDSYFFSIVKVEPK